MRVRVAVGQGREDEVRRLERVLRDDPRLAELPAMRRERVEVAPDELGAVEVLVFVATDVLLPVAIQVLYDYVRDRRRVSPGRPVQVTLTRVDHPDGAREVELDAEGPPDAVIAMVRDALR